MTDQPAEPGSSSRAVNATLMTDQDIDGQSGFASPILYSMVSRGQLPHYRLGRRFVRFKRAEIERWLADHRVPVRLVSESVER